MGFWGGTGRVRLGLEGKRGVGGDWWGGGWRRGGKKQRAGVGKWWLGEAAGFLGRPEGARAVTWTLRPTFLPVARWRYDRWGPRAAE